MDYNKWINLFNRFKQVSSRMWDDGYGEWLYNYHPETRCGMYSSTSLDKYYNDEYLPWLTNKSRNEYDQKWNSSKSQIGQQYGI